MTLLLNEADDPTPLPLNKWTTVEVSDLPDAAEVHAQFYVNVQGKLKAGERVGKLSVRALRNGISDGKPGFDATAYDDRAPVADGTGKFTCTITEKWFGSGNKADTLHWQVKPSLWVASATATDSAHAKGMNN